MIKSRLDSLGILCLAVLVWALSIDCTDVSNLDKAAFPILKSATAVSIPYYYCDNYREQVVEEPPSRSYAGFGWYGNISVSNSTASTVTISGVTGVAFPITTTTI